MDQKLLRSVANAGTDSPFWGTAVQDVAQEILGILVDRSWAEEDFYADQLSAYAEHKYQEFLGLLKSACKTGG
jgi:hypothetical protein